MPTSILKFIGVIIGLIYLVSPYDILPDFFPVLGQFDDLAIILAVIYYLFKGRLPGLDWLRSRQAAPGDYYQEQQGNAFEEEQPQDDDKSENSDPYTILGVDRNAGPEEIKAAYRKASQLYHPDKVSHLGEEFQELARKKFLDIQNAYEFLIGRHN